MDTLDALRLFVSIAEAGNLSAAARQQSVATSTVTLALQQLEERAGTQLIVRSTRKLTFTHEGEQFLADARRLLIDWGSAVDGIRQGRTLKGPLRITATNDFGRLKLAPIIDRFLDIHPEVQITLLLGDGLFDIIDNNLDIALRNGPLSDSNLISRPLIRSQRIICAAPAYWQARGKPSHPDQLAGHNCLLLHRPGIAFSSWPFLIEGKTVPVRVSGNRVANDGGVLRQWAMQGHGIMIKNRWEVEEEIASGALETALDAFALPHVDLYAVTSSSHPSRRVAAMVEFLVEQLRGDQAER
ncbi:LysR family transcriptional regulator [Pseudomonas petrae]|uniref:LysR family transcriptional regulator n=1 Tax=Pseudomonas petrae TaxID=2912190 RepID=A0ABS9IA57_9PSED|nr:LysR family transcriptional regulator [Pseudomonas petrae]MCF7533613.1 LysR family transcriptional regulator [Pseudomonas petrae]MCF7539597.1 LysR family transcriptional regulator [Pseudomonas petrae]MCF7543948.1 LysR family transcriptional regulator [Pseudomonas petrae]MCF7558114.1 LysR family transcriptional regulator [Pseudomonas petrae]